MKKILNFSLFVLMGIFISSCSNDDKASNSQAAQGELIAEIDGASFVSNSNNSGAIYINSILSISGQNSLGTILLTIPEITQAGTFDLSYNTDGDAAGVYTPSDENAYISEAENGGSGQLIITKFDLENELISGTFEFKAIRQEGSDPTNPMIETVEVTNGSFTDLQILIDEIPGDGVSNLSAKVDGNDFNANSVFATEVTMGGNTTINVVANNTTTNQNLALSIPETITVGTHNFSSFPGSGSAVGLYNPDMSSTSNPSFTSISGSITISSYDVVNGKMEGTFFFTAGDPIQQNPTTYEITEGDFDIEF